MPPPDARARARADQNLARLAEAERRMLETERAVSDHVEQLSELSDQQRYVRITHKIRPGLGTIEVDGDGRLLHVSLLHSELVTSDRSLLGRRILEALAAARAEASAQYKKEAARIARRNRV
ncbi:YbaB/EbfC family nucleoid-associated protein [Actinomadura physcomitrii]|uniref:YbaB/EbfC family nucleoid-associated protein n=1 Tax=Actinomadura physcomitrii TaxID=2650748 RepID=UPI00136E41CC|nr:YbaB/EbfC family nucleoid-associated protein [Actinomadura physcomitrii]